MAAIPGVKETIAVVVPYYQVTPGILAGAVQSALAQEEAGESRIIVVDDGSPVPARQELAELSAQWPGRITIIEQRNAGPGAARNNGLDHVPEGTRYVAFLDSDDRWMQSHLKRALLALELGYDFYFSDFYFPTYKQKSAFNRAGKIIPSEHLPIAKADGLFEYQGDLFNQVITGNVIGTPTVVYRYEKFPHARFREEFFNGQDYLFWLDFSLLTRKIAFSSLTECDCGEGFNIYSGAGWGTERSLSRVHNEIKLWRSVARFYGLTPEQGAHNDRRIEELRRGFVENVLYRLRRGRLAELKLLLDHARVDPLFPLMFLPIAVKVMLSKLKPPRS